MLYSINTYFFISHLKQVFKRLLKIRVKSSWAVSHYSRLYLFLYDISQEDKGTAWHTTHIYRYSRHAWVLLWLFLIPLLTPAQVLQNNPGLPLVQCCCPTQTWYPTDACWFYLSSSPHCLPFNMYCHFLWNNCATVTIKTIGCYIPPKQNMILLYLTTKGNRKSLLILEIVAVKENVNLLIRSLHFELIIIGFSCINMLFFLGLV